jgi:hypothetical protein
VVHAATSVRVASAVCVEERAQQLANAALELADLLR